MTNGMLIPRPIEILYRKGRREALKHLQTLLKPLTKGYSM